MKTPIYDFVSNYIETGCKRLHMPGHKGRAFLGCEPYDLTEVSGADELYEAAGIIAESEANATGIFGFGRTFYGAEGSSQAIKAMLYLVAAGQEEPLILAARNVHKAFVYGCALNDIAVEWLYSETAGSVCQCSVSPAKLEAKLKIMKKLPAAVYVTSPDYLGNMQDIGGLAAVCDSFGVPLLVDNAHGAYLKFLPQSLHPLDCGAFMCCDSAHKTLPVLTGGAYLHLSKKAAVLYGEQVKKAMCLFGSTSPSYLILQSLDLCNRYLAAGYEEKLSASIAEIFQMKKALRDAGYKIVDSDPLKLTLTDLDGEAAAALLRKQGVECEYADRNNLVLMFTPENGREDFAAVKQFFLSCKAKSLAGENLVIVPLRQAMGIRQAVFAEWEIVPLAEAAGRICGTPLVSCPPAVPIAVSGELLTAEIIKVFSYYNIERIAVVK